MHNILCFIYPKDNNIRTLQDAESDMEGKLDFMCGEGKDYDYYSLDVSESDNKNYKNPTKIESKKGQKIIQEYIKTYSATQKSRLKKIRKILETKTDEEIMNDINLRWDMNQLCRGYDSVIYDADGNVDNLDLLKSMRHKKGWILFGDVHY